MTAPWSLTIGTGGLGSPPGTLELSPRANGPYRLLVDEFSLGSPTALTRAIESASVDGEKISGKRHGNRIADLVILITGATPAERDARVEVLLGFIDSQAWTLTWTPDVAAPLPMMILCQRSAFTSDYELDTLPPEITEGQAWTKVHITAVARPFVYTPTPVSIQTTGTTSTQIDSYDTPPGGTTSWSSDTSEKTEGAASAYSGVQTVAPDYSGGPNQSSSTGVTPVLRALSGGATVNMTSSDMAVDVRLDIANNAHVGGWSGSDGGLAVNVTFTDNLARTHTLVGHPGNVLNAGWQTVDLGPLASSGGFDATHVRAWTVQLVPTFTYQSWLGYTLTAHIDDLQGSGVLDHYDSTSSDGNGNALSTGGGWAVDTGVHTEGSASLAHTQTTPADGSAGASVSSTFTFDASRPVTVSAPDTAAASVQLRLDAVNDDGTAGFAGSVGSGTLSVTLVDNLGQSVTGSTPVTPGLGGFTRMTVPLAVGAIDYTNIRSADVHLVQPISNGMRRGTVTALHVDDLRGVPGAAGQVSVPNGGTYLAPAIPGTARTPVAVKVTSAGGGATLLEGLILHKAPPEAREDYEALIPYGSTGHALGTRARPVNQGLDYDGTFAVYLAGITTTAAPRQLTVIFEQFNSSGALGSTTLVSLPTYGDHPPPPGGVVALNGLLPVGLLGWPSLPVPDDATGVYTTVTVLDPGTGASAPADVLVLDVRGPTVIASSNSQYLWIDLPKDGRDLGDVLTGPDRANAFGQWAYAEVTGGHFSMDPGDNTFLAYAIVGGPPQVEIDIYPAWLRARTS